MGLLSGNIRFALDHQSADVGGETGAYPNTEHWVRSLDNIVDACSPFVTLPTPDYPRYLEGYDDGPDKGGPPTK